MKKYSFTLLTVSIGLALATSSQVMAQGFALNEQDIAGLGSAYAGRAANAESASVIATNPAGLARLDRIELTANNTGIFASSDIKHPAGSAPGTNKGDMVPDIYLGSLYLAIPHVLVDDLSLGFGVYAPYGLKTDYEDSFQGRYFGKKSYVEVITFQPTAAYRITPNLSFGAGLTINHIKGILSNGISPAFPNASQELDGSDNGLGYNLGFMFTPISKLDLGLTYHSKVDYTLHGSSEVFNAPITATPFTFYARGDGSLKITTPDSIELAASYQLLPTVDVKAGITHTFWSTIKTLAPVSNFTASDVVPSVPLPAQYNATIAATLNSSKSSETLNFQDTNMYTLGAEWRFTHKLTLRGGVGYDESPFRDQYRDPRVPTADRVMFSAGANYKFTDLTNVDVGYMYFFERDAKVNLSDPTKGVYQATYKNQANLIGIQLNQKF